MTYTGPPPDLKGRRIKTYPKDVLQDRPGGPIRLAEDLTRPLIGRVLEQWPGGVVFEPESRTPGWPWVHSFGSNTTFGMMWITAPFTYEVIP